MTTNKKVGFAFHVHHDEVEEKAALIEEGRNQVLYRIRARKPRSLGLGE